MERAVRHLGAQHLDDAAHAALPDRVLRLDDHRAGAHAHQHAVATTVERQRRILDLAVGGSRAGAEEARAHPLHQVVRGQVVGADDDHAAATAHANPVFRDAHRDGGRRAGRVDLRVGAANAEHLGELRVPHGQHLEDEAAIELVVGLLLARLVETHDLADDVVEARERGREDHAGLVGHGQRQAPTIGQVAAGGGLAVVAHERNAGVAQRLDAGAHRQRGGDVEHLGALAGDAELLGQVEGALAPSQADHLVSRTNRLDAGLTHVALVQAHDVLAQHALAHRLGYGLDKGLASQDAVDVSVVEYAAALAGQAQAHARNHDRSVRSVVGRGRGPHIAALVQRHALVEESREQPSEPFVVSLAGRGTVGIAHGNGCSIRMRGDISGDLSALVLGCSTQLGKSRQLFGPGNTGCVEAAHRIVERAHAASLGVVGGKTKDVGLVFEVVLGQRLQGALGTDLDKDACPLAVAGLDALHELHRRRHLIGQSATDGLHVVRGVQLAVDVAHQGDGRRVELHLADGAVQRIGRGRHHLAVEGVRDRDDLRGHAEIVEEVHGAIHGVAGAGDHGLLLAVHVGRGDVAANLGQATNDLVGGTEHGRHLALVADGHRCHGPRTGADRDQGLAEVDHARADGSGPLAQAVAHHHVGEHAVLAQEAHDGDVGRDHRRLADGGVLERLLRVLHARLVAGILVHVARERPSQDRAHGGVGLREGLTHDRVGHVGQHVHVLRALTREQERDLGRGATTEVDALGLKDAPLARVVLVERIDGGLALLGEVGTVLEGDDQAVLGSQERGAGRRAIRQLAGPGVRHGLPEAGAQPRQIGVGDGEHLAEHRGAVVLDGGRDRAARAGTVRGRHLHRRLPLPEHPGHVLLDHDVEVGTAEPERGDATATGRERRPLPRPRLGVDLEGDLVERDRRVGRLVIDRRRQDLVVASQDGLEQARGAGRALEVTDLRLDRSQRDLVLDGRRLEESRDALQLGRVSHASGRSVAFQQGHGGGVEPRALPRTLDGKLLSDRVRGGDALAFAVASAADAADDGVDAITRLLRVFQALADEHSAALAHHEAVGTRIVRVRTVGRERADLAELDEGGRAHVAVHTAGQRHVVVMVDQAIHRGLQARHARGTGRVRGEVRAAQVVHRGHAASDDVGQLARHGVFGGLGQAPLDLRLQLGEQCFPRGRGQSLEGIDVTERFRVFGEGQAQHRLVVALAAHGVAQDDGGGLGVERPIRMASVAQRLAGAQQGPLLPVVHGGCDPGRDAQLGRIEGDPADPTADLRVGLARRLGIGIPVVRRAPSIGRHFGDRVLPFQNVLPESLRVG